MNSIQHIDDSNFEAFMEHDRVALLLTRSTCGNCVNYTQEIQELIEKGRLEDLHIGKVILDQAGSVKLKKANPWIKDLDFVPYTVLYDKGQKVEEFAASRGDYLRLKASIVWAD